MRRLSACVLVLLSATAAAAQNSRWTPAANTANPTAPGVVSFQMCWDGATWDPCSATGGSFDGVLLDAAGGDAITDTVNNALRVNIVAGAGSGGTAMTDDAAFTPATTSVTPMAATFDNVTPDSVDEGDAGAVRMSANRNLFTTLRDAAGNERGANVTAANALVVDGSAVTQPVSGTVTVTATNLDVQIGGSDTLAVGNVATIGTSVTPGTAAGNLGKAEDAVAATGDTGVAVWGVAQATPTATAADGDYIALKTDANGRLWANVMNAGTFATQADTELPTAAALADSTANPTVPGSAAYLMAWNGSTWDRVTTAKDPCDGGTKVFVAISQTTSTQLLTGTASNRTYVCSIALVQAASSTQTFSLVSGTGSVCGTGTSAMMGATTAANGLQQPISHGAGSGTVAKSGANADNVCLLQSGTDRITGVLSYVVAP